MGIGFWGIFGFSLVQGGGGWGFRLQGTSEDLGCYGSGFEGSGCYDPEFRS